MVVEVVKPAEDEEETVPMVDLFILEGVTYSIPDRVRPNVSLKYLWMIRQAGPTAAEAWLMEALLGTDGYLAYLNCNYMTQETSDAIFALARQVVFGELPPKSETGNPKSTSGSQPRRSGTTKRANGSRTRKPPSKATSADTTA